ncbi:hypothetical protein SASPL_127370 [Salvia splendens]|uniref:Glucose-6-phosphate 1-epimerase n=1 Tax=Salvia splendens TaxID=180675 RepID=A0A8X8ZLH7_SALSN|nr:hypothetical protein SASPL_127370 [Salvia splendens]
MKFGKRGSLEKHGFARNRIWMIDENPPPLPSADHTNKAFIDLILKSSDDDLKIWPHSFEFRIRVNLSVDGCLSLTSRIRNVNCKPFSFSFAYHTYFSVSDISEVRVEGLETLDYLDSLFNKERFTEQGDALTFESEKKAKTIADLGDDEYKQMLCVDAAAIEKSRLLSNPGRSGQGESSCLSSHLYKVIFLYFVRMAG